MPNALSGPALAMLSWSVLAGTWGCDAANPVFEATLVETDARAAADESGDPAAAGIDGLAPDLDAQPPRFDAAISGPDGAPGPLDVSRKPDRNGAEGAPSAGSDSAIGDRGLEASTPGSDGAVADGEVDAVAVDTATDVSPTVPTGLIAYWRFDEPTGQTAADSTGNGHNGTLNNGPARVAGGFPGSTFSNPGCIELDGVDDFVDITVGGNFPAMRAAKSVAFWFYLKTQPPKKVTILALTNPSLSTGVQVGVSGGHIALWEWNIPIALMATIDVGWHHVVYTYDGSVHALHVDGTSVGSVPSTLTAVPIAVARLGTFESPKEQFAGRLDDVRVYDRVLPASEIADLAAGR